MIKLRQKAPQIKHSFRLAAELNEPLKYPLPLYNASRSQKDFELSSSNSSILRIL